MEPTRFAENTSEEDQIRSYTTAQRYNEKGIGFDKLMEVYQETCTQYDKNSSVADYNGPRYVAETVAELFPENRNQIKILDAACGTGLVGLELTKLGFKNIDGVDISEGMLNEARKKNIYQKLICQFLGENKLGINERVYDVVTICGAFAESHLPCAAIEELISVIKQGGLIINSTRQEHFDNVEEYKKNAKPLFQKLTDEGTWKLETEKHMTNYIFGRDGLMLIHRIL